MNRILLLTALVLFSNSFSAFAEDTLAPGQYVGQLHEGYAWNDGYWWKGDVPYIRHAVRQTYYDPVRCCNYTRVAYTYQAAPYQKKAETIYPDKDPEWLSKLLDIAKARDADDGYIRKRAHSHNEFLESVKALGLEGNFRWNGYGYEPAYAQGYRVASKGYGQLSLGYSQLPANQGAAIYGYREKADVYGNVDLGGIYKEALRLRGDSRAFEADGDKGTTALVASLGEHAAGVAEIQAKGEAVDRAISAASRALSSVSAERRVQMVKEVWGGSQGADSTVKSADIPKNADAVTIATQVAKTKCLACHNTQKKNGGLDMTDLTLLTDAQVSSILDRIVHPDPQKRMPLAGDLKAGVPLTRTETAAFFLAAYASDPKK